MKLQILQKDIFGESHKNVQEKEKKQSASSGYKPFREITLSDGINEKNLTADSMLILRVLQKKLIYRGLGSEELREKFLRVFQNELLIKSGKLDSATAVRDSLISFFGK